MKRLLLFLVPVLFSLHSMAQTVNVQYLNPIFNSPGTYKYLRLGTNTEYFAGFMLNEGSAEYGDGNDFSIFTYGNRDMTFRTGSGNLIIFPSLGGNVGIGTKQPLQKLDIRGNILLDAGGNATIFTGTGTSELNRYLNLLNSPNKTSASGLKAGGVLVSDSYAYANPGKNDLIVKGNVGIGTASTFGYKLAVNGAIGAKEVKVETTSPWPDYVFEPTYQLTPLTKVAQFITENKHLPEVPSAKEVATNGINLGEMDATLLRKIEELTLYLIEVNKEQAAQKARMEKLEEENALLKQEIDRLQQR